MKVRLAHQAITIRAPRSQVFRLFSSFGHGDQSAETGEGATVLERDGNRLVVEFMSREGKRLYRTLEEVNLFPPERITFRHLQGPLHHATEEIRLTQTLQGTHVDYQGQLECRMPLLPGLGWLVARWYVRPKYDRLIERHLAQIKETAEGADSLVSRVPPPSHPSK